MSDENKRYIWELKDWPRFKFDLKQLSPLLALVHQAQGRLLGRMHGLGADLYGQASLQVFSEDVLKTSEIEGEKLNLDSVRSSVARRLGVDIGALMPADRRVDGVVDMVLDATQNYQKKLSAERLFTWQASLFPGGYSGLSKIRVGAWRDDALGPMQVVSGRIDRQKVHYEAPPAHRLNQEISIFLEWFNTCQETDGLIKAGLAHLWFVTLHPFDDGNGRIARALGDMALARAEQSTQRFYSLSAEIQRERKDYYKLLEHTQKGSLDVTLWLEWFLSCLLRAVQGADKVLSAVLAKGNFWHHFAGVPMNERQIKLLNRLLNGCEGKLTCGKWASIAQCSTDTALRDISYLLEQGVLVKTASQGRSTGYLLKPLN